METLSPPPWPMGQSVASLHPGSTSLYVTGHIRKINDTAVRIQWGKHETAAVASTPLADYIAARPQTCPSVAGTGTLYARARLRQEGPGKVRVQVEGPALNREWGAEFVLSCEADIRLGTQGITAYVTLKDSPVTDGFKIGDTVVIVEQGDGNGCKGGPAVGTVGTLEKSSGSGCGPWDFCHANGTWALTASHIAHVPPSEPD